MKLDSMSSALAVYKALHGSWFKGIQMLVYAVIDTGVHMYNIYIYIDLFIVHTYIPY